MGKPPLFIRIACLAAAGFCLLTAPGGLYIGISGGRWYMVGFESVVLLSSLTCVLSALGMLRHGPALSMLCTGGLVAAASLLSEPTLVARLVQQSGGGAPQAGPNLLPWVAARVGCGVLLVALSGVTVLLRRPGVSFVLLFKGIALGLPVALALGASLAPSIRNAVTNLPMAVSAVGLLFGLALMGALVSLSAHCLIRAFEVGIDAAAAEESRA